MAQTKADRQAAAKKAAATRKRNEIRDKSQSSGKKAASTRQGNVAKDSAGQAGRAVSTAAGTLQGAAKSAWSCGQGGREVGLHARRRREEPQALAAPAGGP